MEIESYFCTKRVESGKEIWICSFWNSLPNEIISDHPLCKIWILANSVLFYSDSDILVNSCNPSFIHSNFFTNLKLAFKGPSAEYSFKFTEDEEENTATLEVIYKIDNLGNSYVSAFNTILIKSFKHNPFEEFMTIGIKVCEAKDVTYI